MNNYLNKELNKADFLSGNVNEDIKSIIENFRINILDTNYRNKTFNMLSLILEEDSAKKLNNQQIKNLLRFLIKFSKDENYTNSILDIGRCL